MDKKEALAKMNEHLKAAQASLDAAKKLADEHDLDFYFMPSYMGVTFTYSNDGWMPSSMDC